ncbi:hypothetical protein MIR68_005398 [Amoeboaphelidium protococcarum]|nr:hypothetical protein MIR68_005398 [Amoeboaphelidium protococcarum]
MFLCTLAVAVGALGLCLGQTAPLQQKDIEWQNKPTRYDVRKTRFSIQRDDSIAPVAQSSMMEEIVFVEGASWVRLNFDMKATSLYGDAKLVIVSSDDSSIYQNLDAESISQWQYTSAYFNGNSVKVQLVTSGAEISSESSFAIKSVTVDDQHHGLVEDNHLLTLCSVVDRREIVKDPRVARIFPIGCTGWLIDDEHHCFLTAGHCYREFPQPSVMQFNVPLSFKNGTIVHPHPNDQYVFDQSSISYSNGGIGRDYMYVGVFANSNTGKAAFEVQQDWFNTTMIRDTKSLVGKNLTINGYGVVRTPFSIRYKSQTLQTHTNPLVTYSTTFPGRNGRHFASALHYQVDTTGGNSGSAIEATLDDGSKVAVGIHTHGGCSRYSSQNTNSGTNLNLPSLQSVLKENARGVCKYGYKA